MDAAYRRFTASLGWPGEFSPMGGGRTTCHLVHHHCKTLRWRKFFNTTAIALQLKTDSVLSLNAHLYALLEVVLDDLQCSESLSSTERTSLPYSASPTTFTAGLRSLHFNRQSELCNENLILPHSFTIQLSALILQLSGCWRLGP